MKTRFGRQLLRLDRAAVDGRHVERSGGEVPSLSAPQAGIRSELEQRIAKIRKQLDSMTARHGSADSTGDGLSDVRQRDEDANECRENERRVDGSEATGELLGETVQTSSGAMHRVLKRYRRSHAQGCCSVAAALEACPKAIASIALDPLVEEVDFCRALYFDTETTGLAGGTGTLPFLLGIAAFDDGGSFEVEQLVLRRPGEERPMLERFAERLKAASCVVSYNGKSFDWPLMRTRFVLNRMVPPELPVHIDLLHCARRVFKLRLLEAGLGVSLTAIEERVFGMGRVDDVAGERIPERYAAFLRGASGAILNPVIEHNAHDLVSLASLLGDLSLRYLRDPSVFCVQDSLGLAKTALRAKDLDAALELARLASTGDSEIAVEALKIEASVALRRRDFDRAVVTLNRVLELSDYEHPDVELSLAKLYEHRLKDFGRALRHAEKIADQEQKRCERLRRRLSKQSASTVC